MEGIVGVKWTELVGLRMLSHSSFGRRRDPLPLAGTCSLSPPHLICKDKEHCLSRRRSARICKSSSASRPLRHQWIRTCSPSEAIHKCRDRCSEQRTPKRRMSMQSRRLFISRSECFDWQRFRWMQIVWVLQSHRRCWIRGTWVCLTQGGLMHD